MVVTWGKRPTWGKAPTPSISNSNHDFAPFTFKSRRAL